MHSWTRHLVQRQPKAENAQREQGGGNDLYGKVSTG